MATDGESNGQLASNIDGPGKHVGKIIVSELDFYENYIEVKSSQIYNPFGCFHHHHINDIAIFDNEIFFSSFSFCDKKNNYIPKGAIFKWNPESAPKLLISNLDHPHTLTTFDKKIFFCSSRASSIFSFFPNSNDTPKLEYKGIDSFVRGLLVTQNYIYFGLSDTMGRSDSKFHNKICALLQFNRRTGETRFFPCPKKCNNLYAIEAYYDNFC